MRRRASSILLPLALLMVLPGCRIISNATYFLGPRRIQKAEFKFGRGPVAIFIESASAQSAQPVFERELHNKLTEIFRMRKVSTKVVSYDRTMKLPRQHPDLRSWSLQKIGRTLGADQLLYIRIVELRIREAPDHPLLNPRVLLELKVIDVNAPPSDARAWPTTTGGLELPPITRPPQEVSSRSQTDQEALKLARKAARQVAQPFYDVDTEEPKPREP